MDKQRSITKTIQGLSDTEAWDLYRCGMAEIWKGGERGRKQGDTLAPSGRVPSRYDVQKRAVNPQLNIRTKRYKSNS